MIHVYRETIYLPSVWSFILVCSVLRFIEGIGVGMYITTAYTVAAKLYPDSTGSAIVSKMCTHGY